MGEVVSIQPNLRQDDADLVEACRRGDRAALQEVFRAHTPYIERILIRIVGSGPDAEDLLQATFVAAIRSFPRFRGEAMVRTWLARIAIRTAHEALRRPDRRRRVRMAPEDARWEAEEGARDDRRLEQQLDARRRIERLQHHLSAIGPKKRIAFVLHVFEGRSMEDVAALMGASRAATKSRVFFARRELLKRAGNDPALKDLVSQESER
jgi:RNA polymerase sigma-70 factor (ECF subfamily)